MLSAGIHTVQDMLLRKTCASSILEPTWANQMFSFQEIDLWRDIPHHVKDLTTFSFSKEIKRYLLSEQ